MPNNNNPLPPEEMQACADYAHECALDEMRDFINSQISECDGAIMGNRFAQAMLDYCHKRALAYTAKNNPRMATDEVVREAFEKWKFAHKGFVLGWSDTERMLELFFESVFGYALSVIASKAIGSEVKLLRDMRMEVIYTHVATMPIPLYERMKEALSSLPSPTDKVVGLSGTLMDFILIRTNALQQMVEGEDDIKVAARMCKEIHDAVTTHQKSLPPQSAPVKDS